MSIQEILDVIVAEIEEMEGVKVTNNVIYFGTSMYEHLKGAFENDGVEIDDNEFPSVLSYCLGTANAVVNAGDRIRELESQIYSLKSELRHSVS